MIEARGKGRKPVAMHKLVLTKKVAVVRKPSMHSLSYSLIKALKPENAGSKLCLHKHQSLMVSTNIIESFVRATSHQITSLWSSSSSYHATKFSGP